MSAAKNKGSQSGPPGSSLSRLLAWLMVGDARGATWSLVLIGGFIIGAAMLWRHVSRQVTSGESYLVHRDDVEISPPPSWIRADLAADVLRSMSLDGAPSVLDADLAEQMAAAFAAHPWVAKVERVTKYHPARVRVELKYRRPVCMVELPAGVLDRVELPVESGLLPVDERGVLLPDADFSAEERLRYPRVSDITTTPRGTAGITWGDPRVAGAAEVAAVLVDAWSELSLERIVPSRQPNGSFAGDEYTYEVRTRGGTRIRWGRSPTTRMPGELPAAEKLSRLRKYKGEHGSLDGPGGPQEIDLRNWHRMTAVPRGAGGTKLR